MNRYGTFSRPIKLADRVGAPHVCDADLDDVNAVKACVRAAVASQVPPLIPKELTEAAYTARIENIFGPFLPARGRLQASTQAGAGR